MSKPHASQTQTNVRRVEELSETDLELVVGGALNAYNIASQEEVNVLGAHQVDKASPVLMKACATGTHIKEATITH